MDRFLTRLSQRAAWSARQRFRVMRFAVRTAPTLYGSLAARIWDPADGAVIRDEGFDAFARMAREASRQLHGAVEGILAWVRPWEFTSENLTDIWAGTDDQLVDPGWARRLASEFPTPP